MKPLLDETHDPNVLSLSLIHISSAKAAATRDRDQDDTDDAPKPATVKPGTTGPMQFLKGKIVSSDCSKPPEATVTVLSGMTTYKMHASDYKSLLVIGEDQFSCDWKNRLVSINYRAAGKNAGELVSCLLYTSPTGRERSGSSPTERMTSAQRVPSAIP